MNSQVVLAYANHESDPVALHAVRRALPQHARRVRHTPGDDGYGKLFRELWLAGRPFIIVEHDVIPAPGMLEQLDGCPHPFCAHGYGPGDHLPESGALMGLSAFRPVGDVPFEKAIPEGMCKSGVPHYEHLADAVYASLAARGIEVHQHFPPVTHLGADWSEDSGLPPLPYELQGKGPRPNPAPRQRLT